MDLPSFWIAKQPIRIIIHAYYNRPWQHGRPVSLGSGSLMPPTNVAAHFYCHLLLGIYMYIIHLWISFVALSYLLDLVMVDWGQEEWYQAKTLAAYTRKLWLLSQKNREMVELELLFFQGSLGLFKFLNIDFQPWQAFFEPYIQKCSINHHGV